MAAPRADDSNASPPSSGRLEQLRWRVLALIFLITVINFVDRQTLSVVAPVLREQFQFSASEYGRIVSAFMFGMMTGEFLNGWLMDRRGVRFGLALAVVSWSLATALHSLGRSALHFGLLRFWMGTGESANFPAAMKVVSEWFPVRERAFAVGIFNSGTMIGSILAPPLIVYLMLNFGWRMAFIIPGLLGFVWVCLWRVWYAARPVAAFGEQPQAPPPNAILLRRRQAWALMICRMLVGPVVQFYWFWTPDYLYSVRGLSLKAIGAFAWLPFLFGDIGSIGGGWATGLLMRRGFTVDAARRTIMALGAICCLFSFAVANASSAGWAIAAICVVLLGHTALSANMFAAISDVFPQGAVGRVTGLTGIAGGLGGLLFPLLTGYLIDRVSYTPVFLLAAVMPALGVLLLFLLIGKLRPVELRW